VAAALRYAGRGVKSEQDVVRYLRRRGTAQTAIRRAMAACRLRGVVDDPAAARLCAESWARQGYSAAAIQSRLVAKGFGESVAERTSGRLKLEAGDASRARQVAARQQRTGRVRAGRRLAARGFEPDVIVQALEATFGPTSE
jgi:SOS response regulatory protein OraA/RecX